MNRFGVARARAVALVIGLGSLALAGAAQGAPSSRLSAWKQSIAKTNTPGEGCFTASYPSVAWQRVSCSVAPLRPFYPRSGHPGRTVGDGQDYAAVSPGLTAMATGSFTVVTGVKTEKNFGHRNEYSLQLNSNVSSDSKACETAATPSSCVAWEQFIFSNADGNGILFEQYWLIGYDKACPVGWSKSGHDCFRNSDSAIFFSPQPILQLHNLQMSGKVVLNGLDTITMATASHAYSVTNPDSVLGLAKFWNLSEFNIVGNGQLSQVKFNSGSSLTVQIVLDDGKKAAPVCQANGGQTGETNNLNLVGICTTAAGATPSVAFTESN